MKKLSIIVLLLLFIPTFTINANPDNKKSDGIFNSLEEKLDEAESKNITEEKNPLSVISFINENYIYVIALAIISCIAIAIFPNKKRTKQ